MSINKYDTIVVGAGIAGLSSAVYLARANNNVLLIEKNDKCGGLVNSFRHQGFHFEAGVRALESAGIILPMLKDLNINLEFVKSSVSVGIENEVLNIVDKNSIDDYQLLLAKLYPSSKDEIDKTIKIIKKIMKHMDVLYGIENPIFKDLKKDKQYVFRQLLPWLPKFLFTVRKINRLNMPVEDYIDEFIKNPSLKDIITQHFFKNTPAFFALSYFSLYLDYFYPKGGVGKLAEALENKILEYGGLIQKETTIKELIADKNVIIDSNHKQYKYNKLIWAADLKSLYNICNSSGLSVDEQTKFTEMKNSVNASRGGESVYTLYLEVDEAIESFAAIANGHFFYTPNKSGLGNIHWDELNELIENWDKKAKSEIFSWLDKFTLFNTYEISIPGLKDSDLVPKNKTGLIVSFLAEYELFKKARSTDWYKEFIEEINKRIINVLSNSIYPVLKDKIIHHFAFTPLSIENRVGSSEGAITGWSFQKNIPVVNKMQYSDKSVLTAIPDVYQAGQWAYSPAGVPMSILTGKLAADRIVKMK